MKRNLFLSLCATSLMSAWIPAEEPAPAAAYVFEEAEDFSVLSGDWEAKPWGTNYYAASFANSFLSRQRYLGAPEQGKLSEAAADVEIPQDGAYHVCIRYEAAYNFETQFGLRIEQGGQEVFRRSYGGINNPKLWAFHQGIQPQVRWTWGPVENIVWEGTDAKAELKKGPAKLILFKDAQPAPAARRNVDVIVLTTDSSELDKRIKSENYLALDGLLTQAGDLFAKVKNPADAKTPVMLQSPAAQEHSPYWIHIRRWTTLWVDKNGAYAKEPAEPAWIAPGEESPWFDLGSQMDALNASGYFPQVQYPKGSEAKGIDLEFTFAVPGADGQKDVVRQIRYTDPKSNGASFSVPGSVRHTRKVQTHVEILEGLLNSVQHFPQRGRVPQNMLFFNTFHPGNGDSRQDELMLDICLALGNNVVNDMPNGVNPVLAHRRGVGFRQTTLVDVRDIPTPKLKDWTSQMKEKGQWPYIKVVSLGDEIGLGGAQPGPETDEAFRVWLRNQNLQPADIIPVDPKSKEFKDELWKKVTFRTDTQESNPRLFYHAARFGRQAGIDHLKERTKILEERLPKGVLIGANYSPHPDFWPHYTQWISVFRQRAMTLPWSEDYIWQIPVTSQQVLGYIVSAFRCAALKHDLPILMYVMPHTPGNTPASFRRAFYADVAHGTKHFNFFEPIPTTISYTENNMLPESTDMYRAIYDVIRDAGQFEGIVFPGRVRPAEVGIVVSDTTEIWNHSPLYNAERQHLYMALKHAQIPVDIVCEDDIAESRIDGYKILYLAVTHLRDQATRSLARWVREGGYVFATAGAGLRDEFNQPSLEMEKLLGVSEAGLEISSDLFWGKDNLPRLKAMDTIHHRVSPGAKPSSVDAYLAKALFRPMRPSLLARLIGAGRKVEILGSFSNSTPALFEQKVGDGKAITCATFPGTAYFKPSIPDRPCDRGATDDAMAHFLPTKFSQEDRTFISRWALEAGAKRPIVSSEDLVETSWIESTAGIAVPLINYGGQKIASLELKIFDAGTIQHVASVTHGKLEFEVRDQELRVKVPLDVADMLLLYRNRPRQ